MNERTVIPTRPAVVRIDDMYTGQGVLNGSVLAGPGVANVRRLYYRPTVASHHPARPAIQEEDVVEVGGDRNVQHMPGHAAVGGAVPDAARVSGPTDDDRGLRV